jgi:ferric-dicitrate binding protein FerR (iron transport regulator)
MENKDNFESVLLRYIQGNVSEEEIVEVELWLNDSAENRKILEQLLILDYACDVEALQNSSKPHQSFENVKKKIRQEKIHRIINWCQKVAAILLIPFIGLTLYFSQDKKTDISAEYIEINSAPGVVTTIRLPDSTKVWLNSNSYIRYPSSFNGNYRDVAIRGEVYFSVSKDIHKPFIVNVANEFNIKVCGTEFNIEAYPSTSSILTTLVEGSIQLAPISNPEQIFETLQPGECSSWDTKTKTLSKMRKDVQAITSWKEGKIILKNTPIEKIAEILEKRYNAQVLISPRLKNQRFTGTFTNQQLIQILEHFKISSNIKYEMKGIQLNEDGTIGKTIVELK